MKAKQMFATIKWRCAMLTVLTVLNLFAVGYILQHTQRRTARGLREVTGTQLPAVRLMTLIDMVHDQTRAVVYKAIFVGSHKDQKDLAQVQEEIKEVPTLINKYLTELEALSLTSEVRDTLNQVAPQLREYVAEAAILSSSALKGRWDTQALEKFNARFEALTIANDTLGDKIESAADQIASQTESRASVGLQWGLVAICVGVFLNIFLTHWFSSNVKNVLRRVSHELRRQVVALKHGVQNLASSSSELAASSSEQASALQETAASLEEITSMVNKSADNAKRSLNFVTASRSTAEKGGQVMGRLGLSMEGIHQSTTAVLGELSSTNQKLKDIAQLISQIGEKTKVINNIVFQTQLLSFNASVEAARAGEHGKGFSVVAEEVGNLARLSGNAAHEIEEMLAGSIRSVQQTVEEIKVRTDAFSQRTIQQINDGLAISKECGVSLGEIVANESKISTLVDEIAGATQEQAAGVSEINRAVAELDRTTTHTAVAAKHVWSFSETIQQQSEAISVVLGDLSLLLGEKVEDSDPPAVAERPTTTSERRDGSNVRALRSIPGSKSSLKSGKLTGTPEVPRSDDPRFKVV